MRVMSTPQQQQQQHEHTPALSLHDPHTGHRFLVCNQPSDIDACVAFSYVRCLFSIISILLAITDIPRTGLAVDLFAFYPRVAPNTVIYYGPYAYPGVHLNQSSCHNDSSVDGGAACGSTTIVQGYAGNTPVPSVDVWGYKFDTLSIPTRALAEHLNVSTYPRCLLYQQECARSTLSLDSTFTMLNDLVTAIQQRYFQDASRHSSVPVVFRTDSFWADRLHHVLFGELGYRVDHRIHSVHYFKNTPAQTGRLDVCKTGTATDRHRPLLCSLVVKWRCDHPTRRQQTQVPLHEHINLRFSALQQKYPDTQLDLTIITTRSVIQSQRMAFLPTVFYKSENLEITTFIRGQRCQGGEKDCTTVFVDDYRYERAVVESSSSEMKMITGLLRAASQLYVWLRVLLLGFICYQSRLAEPSHRSKSPVDKLRVVGLTILKIPSHTLIYSSWFPILAYSFAHFIDCGPVHLLSDSFWLTSNGFFTFEFFSYVVVATVQMRNIWLIALFWKGAISIYSRVVLYRARLWRPWHGVLAFRGVFIGMASFLTIFSFVRALQFRNTNVLHFIEVPRHAGTMRLRFPPLSSTMSDFGNRLDMKTTLAASVLIGIVGLVVQTLLRTSIKSTTSFFTCQNHYVPSSAGTLYSMSALNVFWYIRLVPLRTNYTAASAGSRPRSISVAPEPRSMSTRCLDVVQSAIEKHSSLPRKCTLCGFTSAPLNWRPTQGCLRHESIFSVGARSVETQSMVRLTNIGMFSDPIVFLRLRLLGTRLHLYRVGEASTWASRRGSEADAISVASSFAEHSAAATLRHETSFVLSPVLLSEQLGHSASSYQLVASIDSKHVPWTLLVDCG